MMKPSSSMSLCGNRDAPEKRSSEMVKGYRLCEKPDPEFYKIMRELSAIGNRINQLAAKANALGFVDTPMLNEEARKWHEFQIDIRKKYLLPRRAS